MAINYSYPSGTVTSEDLVLIMDMDSKGKPTRTVTAQAIANLYNAGGVAGVASFTTSLNGLTPNVATTGAVTLAGTLGVASGGTGSTTFAQGGVLYGDTANPLAATAVGTSGHVLTSNGAGAAPTFQATQDTGITSLNAQTGATQTFTNMANGVTITSAANAHVLGLAGQIPVANGGTGLGSYTTGDIVYASGATTLAGLTVGSASQVLKGGATPTWGALVNQAAFTQYDVAVGGGGGEIEPSSRIQIGRSAANSVEIGNGSSANLVYINSTDASSTTYHRGKAEFAVTFNAAADENIALGLNSLASGAVTGTKNSSVGVGSLGAVTSGGNNVAVGTDAGNVLTTGSGNVLLGNNADASALGDNYAIAIGDGASAGQGGIAVGRNAAAGAAELAIGNITLSTGQNTGAATLPIKINGVQYYIRIYT